MKVILPAIAAILLLAAAPAPRRAVSFTPSTIGLSATADVTPFTIKLSFGAPSCSSGGGKGPAIIAAASAYRLAWSLNAPIDLGNFDGCAMVAETPATPKDYNQLEIVFAAGFYATGTYYFALRADYDGETSAILTSTSIHMTGDSVAPGDVPWAVPAVGTATSSSIEFRWMPVVDGGSPASGLDRYEVRVRSDGPITTLAQFDAATRGAVVPVPASGPQVTTAVVEGLDPQTTYWAGVVATDRAGIRSIPASISLSGLTLPPPPEGPKGKSETGPGCGLAPAFAAPGLLAFATLALLIRRID